MYLAHKFGFRTINIVRRDESALQLESLGLPGSFVLSEETLSRSFAGGAARTTRS